MTDSGMGKETVFKDSCLIITDHTVSLASSGCLKHLLTTGVDYLLNVAANATFSEYLEK